MAGSSKRGDLTNGSEEGFTLVELLAALALFSLLVIVVFENVQFGLKAWRHGLSHAGHFEANVGVRAFLRRVISESYPFYTMDVSGKGARIEFEGSENSLRFLAPAPVVVGGGERFQFALFTERHNERNDLMLTAVSELAVDAGKSPLRKTVLLSDVELVSFSYFGALGPTEFAQWNGTWKMRSEMPKLVRVHVKFRSTDVRSWPDLLIAPRIGVDAGCVYDPITQRCRGR